MRHFVSRCKVHQSLREHDADGPSTDAQPGGCSEFAWSAGITRNSPCNQGWYGVGRFHAKP